MWHHQVEVGDVDARLVPVDQRDPIRGHADVARGRVAVDHTPLSSGESRPRCSAANDTLRRHRAEVDLRPGFRVQEVGRRSPARALGPAVRQSVQLAECVGDATPVGLRFGRPALHVGHHDQTVDEVPAVHGRDRHRHRHPFTIEVPQQLGLPREVGVAAPAEPTDGELPVDAHAPHFVDAPVCERFDASGVVTPLSECLPSHGHIFAVGRERFTHTRSSATGSGQRLDRIAVDLDDSFIRSRRRGDEAGQDPPCDDATPDHARRRGPAACLDYAGASGGGSQRGHQRVATTEAVVGTVWAWQCALR